MQQWELWRDVRNLLMSLPFWNPYTGCRFITEFVLFFFFAAYRPFLCLCHDYVTALAGGKTKGKLEEANSNQHRFGYIRSLKYHLVVMLGARIDVVQSPIWNFIAYLLPLPDKKNPTTAVVKRDKTSGPDRKDRQKMLAIAVHTSYQKRLNKVLSFVVMDYGLCYVSKDFLCFSWLCCVWNVCVHVCKTTNWWFICNIHCCDW